MSDILELEQYYKWIFINFNGIDDPLLGLDNKLHGLDNKLHGLDNKLFGLNDYSKIYIINSIV